jgi:Ca2+-binding RTX toxin-like protein
MPYIRAAHLSAAAVVLAAATSAVTAPAHADTPTCDGKPASIVGPGPGNVTYGTPGDDVVVTVAEVANGSNGGIYTYEGNDTVCIVPGTGAIPDGGQADFFTVETGTGNDKVLNQEPRNTSDLFVVLGAGADTFVGNDRREVVYAGEPKVTGWIGPDDAQDHISTAGGDDRIQSGAPGAVNADVISTGLGYDEIALAGTGTSLDNGIEEGRGDRLFLVGEQWKQRLVTIDNRQEIATGDSSELLRWNNVTLFEVRSDSPLRYIGSDDRDTLYVTSTLPPTARTEVPVDVSLNGGDDHFWFYNGIAPGRVDGGTGHDTLVPENRDTCTDVMAILNSSYTCTFITDATRVSYVVNLSEFETYQPFEAARTVAIHGTNGRDQIAARSHRVLVKGFGGGDRIFTDRYEGSDNTARATVRGGPGADRLTGSRGKETLYGGPGADTLIGKEGKDELAGGTGRDAARGGPGTDRCTAEKRQSCEKG